MFAFSLKGREGTTQPVFLFPLCPDRGEENLPRTNEEIARIHWNMIIADEVIFQGRTMAKDRFIHKKGSGPEACVISWVTFPWL